MRTGMLVLGIALIFSGMICWVSDVNPVNAEMMEVSIEVTETSPPALTLTVEDNAIVLGSAEAGSIASGTIVGTVQSTRNWKMTYTATDFNGSQASIPITNATISGKGIPQPITLDTQGTIYKNREPTDPVTGYAYEHEFSLAIPASTLPGKYTAVIDYTVTQLP